MIGHGYLSPLWNTATGRLLAILAIGLVAAGSLWIKRITEIEV